MLLGTVITQLRDEGVALDTLLSLDDLALLARVRHAADAEGLALGEFISDAIGRFIQAADDEAWLALMSAAARAEDPGTASLRCMLDHALSTVHGSVPPAADPRRGDRIAYGRVPGGGVSAPTMAHAHCHCSALIGIKARSRFSLSLGPGATPRRAGRASLAALLLVLALVKKKLAKFIVEGIMAGPRVLEDLRAEHRSMGKLLELLEHQLELVSQDRRADCELLLQIAQYFASVPDVYHHPKEDVVLRRLAARQPAHADSLSLLEAEHEEGGREVQLFLRAVVRLALEPERGAERFLRAGRALIDNERRHMSWEEKNFFQLAERVLLPEDWKAIESRLRSFLDPLQNTRREDRFSRIDRALAVWRSATAPGAPPAPSAMG